MIESRVRRLRGALAATCVVAVASATLGASAFAADAAPSAAERAIKYRQSALYLLGWNIGPIAAMVKGEMPYDAKALELRATRLAQLAPMIAEGFPTGSQAGAPTRAKPEIWQNMDDFRDKAAKLEAATARLVAASKTADLKQVGPVLGDVGAACKACHDQYRTE